MQHTVEGGPAICEKEVIISCEGFTIEENEDECLGDFACFRYISNYCPTDQLTWDFGDGTVITCTGCATVEHCYTNVNTFYGTNTQVMPSVTINGQIFSQNLDISNFDMGIFIGTPNGISNLTAFNAVLPGNSYNGSASGDPVYVYGTVNLDKSFGFSATEIIVERSGGLNVRQSRILTLNNSTTMSSAANCPCLWRGIDVYSSGTLSALQGTELSEALYTVRAFKDGGQNPIIGLRGVSFFNNYIGLMADATQSGSANAVFTFDFNTGFTGNSFTSTAVKNWCGGGDNVPDAFGPSGGSFSADRGWAGVYLREVDVFQVPAFPNAGINTFSNLANGFYMVNSSAMGSGSFAGIWNCQFVDMLRGGYPIPVGGHGIFFSDNEGGHSLVQGGFGNAPTAMPSFLNCEVGILAEAVSGAGGAFLASFANMMRNMEVGYRVDGITGDITARITENEIHSDVEFDHYPLISAGVWIEDRNQQPNNHIVDENVIVVNQPTETFGFGVFIRGNFDMNPTTNTISVGNNVNNAVNPNDPGITVEEGTSCVHIVQYGGVDVHNNVMLAQLNTAAGLNGTFILGGQDHDIRCNEIVGPVANAALANIRAISISGSLDPAIVDNHLTNFNVGMLFNDPCGFGVNFSCNQFLGTQDVGLSYSDDAITGWQVDRGNQWLGTYNNWGAEHDQNSPFLNINRYDARQSTTEWPPSISLPGWFFGSPIIPQCPIDPECETPPGEMLMEEVNYADSLVAQGQTGGQEGIRWIMAKYLYNRLLENLDAWQGNELMESFVSTQDNAPLGQFHALAESIEVHYQIPADSQSLLSAAEQTIEAKRTEVSAIEAELATTPPGAQFDSLLQERQQRLDDIAQLMQSIAAIHSTLHYAKVLRADSLLALITAIEATEIYEINEKEFFEVYLNTIAKDNTNVSTAQLTILENIAAQCPEIGGRAVYWAIGLYGHLTGALLEVQDCSIESRSSSNTMDEEKIGSEAYFTLSPNPSSGKVLFEYQIPENKSGVLVISHISGIEVARILLNSPANQRALSDFPSGVYLVTLLIDKEVIQTEKMIVH